MLVLAGFVIGCLAGIRASRRRGKTGLDVAQQAGSYGIAFAILGLFATMALGWMGVS